MEPEISVVMIDLHEDLGASLRALGAQGATDRVELVLVTAEVDRDAMAVRYPMIRRFGEVILAPVPELPTTGAALAAGMRAATGPVVAYCEDHVLPEPGWVKARLAGHAAGAAVVAGALRNANPASATSWATFLHGFGPFVAPVPGGPSAQLPWHQCSYQRDVLPRGPELDGFMETEGLFHAELLKDGHTLVLEPRCVAGHVNPSRPASMVSHAFNGGRVWGAARADHGLWSARQRLRHALLLGPYTVFRELPRRFSDVARVIPGRRHTILPLLTAASILHALGEAAGVVLGSRAAVVRQESVELNRSAHLASGERVPRR